MNLHARANRDGQKRGSTAAGLIESRHDDFERRRRMESFGRAFRGADAEYWDEFTSWNLAIGDINDAD